MSKRFSDEEIRAAYDQLVREQSPVSAVIGAVIGAMPASAILFVFVSMGGTFLWLLFLPAAIVGYTAGYTGRVYEFKYRVIPGIIAAIIHALGLLVLFQNHMFYLVTLPLSFGVAVYLCKRKLDTLQEAAIWAKKYGKLVSNSSNAVTKNG